MDTIGIRDLRSNLARIVRSASDGHSITITQHGEPCAQIGPVGAGATGIELLLSTGALVPPRRGGRFQWPAPTEVAVGTRIDVALRDVRG